MKILAAIRPFLTVPIIGLCGVSLFILASTLPNLLTTQAVYFAVGAVLYVLFNTIDYRLWDRFIYLAYGLMIILLLLSFIGPNIRGSTRWVEIGNFQFQPSEFTKPLMILAFASFLARRDLKKLKNILQAVVLFFPVAFLIFKQPDLGNVIVYTVVFLTLLFISGLPWKYVIGGVVVAIILSPLFWTTLHDYQRHRIISFLSPHTDPSGTGYNALQAMIAIGSGQVFGLGLGRGTQSKLLFLPEYHTDFVFASLGEELGFVGGIFVILCYGMILGKILHTCFVTEDSFGRYICAAIFAQLFIQVFINIGMNIGLLPITGITLPLVSYGGSSILSTFIGLGIIGAIENTRKKLPLVIR